MKKNLFIHIGRPKVGSTAIQKFLKVNRKVLLENGVLYPVTGERQNASHQLSDVLLPESKYKNLPSAESLYAELIEEIENSTASNCIVSSENFYFVKPKLIEDMLMDRFDVKILCYVRRQDEVLVSSFIQELRDDTLSTEEREDTDLYLKRPIRLRFLDYKIMLDKWAQIFGEDNIDVRVYEKGQLQGDLFSDILSSIGLTLTEKYSIPRQRINPTPSSDVLELIKNVNSYPTSSTVRKQIKSRLVEISENIGHSKRFDSTRIFSNEQKRKVLAHFDKSNAATARKYLKRGDGRLFYEGIEDDDPETTGAEGPQGDFDLARMVKIWVSMTVHQQQQLNKLEMKLEILKRDVAGRK